MRIITIIIRARANWIVYYFSTGLKLLYATSRWDPCPIVGVVGPIPARAAENSETILKSTFSRFLVIPDNCLDN